MTNYVSWLIQDMCEMMWRSVYNANLMHSVHSKAKSQIYMPRKDEYCAKTTPLYVARNGSEVHTSRKLQCRTHMYDIVRNLHFCVDPVPCVAKVYASIICEAFHEEWHANNHAMMGECFSPRNEIPCRQPCLAEGFGCALSVLGTTFPSRKNACMQSYVYGHLTSGLSWGVCSGFQLTWEWKECRICWLAEVTKLVTFRTC